MNDGNNLHRFRHMLPGRTAVGIAHRLPAGTTAVSLPGVRRFGE